MTDHDDPFFNYQPKDHTDGPYSAQEVGLANRNSGIPLEGLRYDVTPVGMHYLLTHFDIPDLSADSFQLQISGEVDRPVSVSLADLKAMPAQTRRVTLECSGNGRALFDRRSMSMPWRHEAVSTAEWTGTPLVGVLAEAGLTANAVDVVFYGADRGFDKGVEHYFGRSLSVTDLANLDALLVYEMNGQPLLPQHGQPLRLVVPGWFGMASVKWLTRIEVLDHPFDGFQQVGTYRYRQDADDPGSPIQELRVKSLLIPPKLEVYVLHSKQRLLGVS